MWSCQDIADSINEALSGGEGLATCELSYIANPDPRYLIKLESIPVGTAAVVSIQDGTFEPSLTDILEAGSTQPGRGAYLGMARYYKVRAVEEVSGNIVRYGEYSNISMGKRQLNLPEFT